MREKQKLKPVKLISHRTTLRDLSGINQRKPERPSPKDKRRGTNYLRDSNKEICEKARKEGVKRKSVRLLHTHQDELPQGIERFQQK